MDVALAVAVIAALAVIAAIAFVSVGHAVGATESMPAQIIIDVEESVEFCAQALPDHVTASLSYDDLRRLLRLHLEWIQAYHWAPASRDSTPIVFEQFDPVAYVMERCHVIRLEVTAEEAAAVIQAHSDYLQVAGALHIDDPVNVEADLSAIGLLGDGPDESPMLPTTPRSDEDPTDP